MDDVATIVTRARRQAGLSKRELARRAGTSPAAIVAYEGGRHSPTVRTLERIIDATGKRLLLELDDGPVLDPAVQGARLVTVLELADALPHRPAARLLPFPRLPA